MDMMRMLKRLLTITLSLSALAATIYGMYCAMRSPLFTVRVVEVANPVENAPVDADTIEALAAVPVGKVNLFDLDLGPIEKRILANSWIREVRLHKRFPQTLSISVVYREPQALMQSGNGRLTYVDADGTSFGTVNLLTSADLPILEGLDGQPAPRIRAAIELLGAWNDSELHRTAEISSLAWDSERGYRAWISYPLQQKGGVPGRSPVQVELGQDLDEQLNGHFDQLNRVVRYLSSNAIAARQIWADTGKKIVVKTARGS